MKGKRRRNKIWFLKVWLGCLIVTVLLVAGSWTAYLLRGKMAQEAQVAVADEEDAQESAPDMELPEKERQDAAGAGDADAGAADAKAPDAGDPDVEASDAGDPDPDSPDTGAADAERPAAEDALSGQAEEKLSAMTIEQKVAQMFFITPEALTGYEKVTAAGEATAKALEQYPVGGLVYLAQNLQNPQQTMEMLRNVQTYAKETEGLPLFLSIDEEGGTVARIGNNEGFSVAKIPDMAQIGAAKDASLAYQAGETIGGYMSEYGFNLDFAPDADVLTNPQNQVVKKRSFGSDAQLVTEMSLQFAKGLQEHQILACFKHFPGHGATQGDTHEGFAYTDKTLEELYEQELVPFQAAAREQIPFVMISHISVPNVIGDNTPTSLSHRMVTDILRGEMGYAGIIITDAMGMGAITENYGADEAVVQAVQAGADMILMPQDFRSAYRSVLDAVSAGEISERRINASVRRILRVKLGL